MLPVPKPELWKGESRKLWKGSWPGPWPGGPGSSTALAGISVLVVQKALAIAGVGPCTRCWSLEMVLVLAFVAGRCWWAASRHRALRCPALCSSTELLCEPNTVPALSRMGQSESCSWPELGHQVWPGPSQLASLCCRGEQCRGGSGEGVHPQVLGVPPLPLPNSVRVNEV